MKNQLLIPHRNVNIQGTFFHNSTSTLIIVSPGFLVTTKTKALKKPMEIMDQEAASFYIYDSLSYINTPLHKKIAPIYENKVNELKDIVAYFQKSYSFKNIILEGGSLGAFLCSVIATQIVGISALITINGVFDFDRYFQSYPHVYLFLNFLILDKSIRKIDNFI